VRAFLNANMRHGRGLTIQKRLVNWPHNMDAFKQHMVGKCGPGGLNCTCCNPFHHKGKSKDKRKLNRIARRSLKRQMDEA
jgi:hypothetical protein